MKVGIITFHRADNYGALLQTLALMSVIDIMGHDVEIIDYRCTAIEDFYRYRYMPHFHFNPLNYFKEFFYNIKWGHILKTKSSKCNCFRDSYFKLSRSVYSIYDRGIIENEYDLILTGSDQIWSSKITHGIDDWYAFKKTNTLSVVASYGASVGSLSLFRMYYKLYEKNLHNYDLISVREKNVQKFLSDRLEDRQISVVADPTLLLDFDFWKEISRDSITPSHPYILYYDVDYNPIASSIVKRVATEKGLDVVFFKKVASGQYKTVCVADAGPSEFLGLIKNACYVVSSSFHATVFSIIFQKRFLSVIHPKTGDRVKSLLNNLGLSKQQIESEDEFEINNIDNEINWASVNNEIKKIQEISKDYLKLCFDTVSDRNGKRFNNGEI